MMRVTSLKNQNFAQNQRGKGVMRSFYMYITQIKPLENRDYKRVLKRPPSTSNNASYKPKNPANCSESLSERGYEVIFHVQIKPMENGDYDSVPKRPPSTSNNASYKQKNSENCSEPLSERGYAVVFHLYHKNQKTLL